MLQIVPIMSVGTDKMRVQLQAQFPAFDYSSSLWFDAL
jgi:hypothetical protein